MVVDVVVLGYSFWGVLGRGGGDYVDSFFCFRRRRCYFFFFRYWVCFLVSVIYFFFEFCKVGIYVEVLRILEFCFFLDCFKS